MSRPAADRSRPAADRRAPRSRPLPPPTTPIRHRVARAVHAAEHRVGKSERPVQLAGSNAAATWEHAFNVLALLQKQPGVPVGIPPEPALRAASLSGVFV